MIGPYLQARGLASLAAIVILCPGRVILAQDEPGEETRPNIVFIRTDDQARWAVGFNGNEEVHTPYMDRLHREGVSFSNAFVTTPVCSPSRVALMSGLHGIQAGVNDWIRPEDKVRGINPDYIIWPEALHNAGYVTGYIGKWHMGTAPKFHPMRNGFDHFMGLLAGGTRPLGPTLEVNGRERTLKGVYTSDFLTDDALHFIRQNRHMPFLVMLEFRAPHSPYAPAPPAAEELYKDLDPAVPDDARINHERATRLTREYYAAITGVDTNIGRVLDVLDELELAQNTIVIFTSDHGYMIGHHALHHKGNATYFLPPGPRPQGPKWRDPARRRPNMFDDSLRVPLAIRWPARIAAGGVVDEMTVQTDLYPTILSLAGVETPTLPEIQPIRGRDLTPLIDGEEIPWRDAIFGDYDMEIGKRARLRMIRTSEWKLVKHYEEENAEHELYDLVNDPGETKNLYADPPDADVLEDVERRLFAWQQTIDDPLLRGSAD